MEQQNWKMVRAQDIQRVKNEDGPKSLDQQFNKDNICMGSKIFLTI